MAATTPTNSVAPAQPPSAHGLAHQTPAMVQPSAFRPAERSPSGILALAPCTPCKQRGAFPSPPVRYLSAAHPRTPGSGFPCSCNSSLPSFLTQYQTLFLTLSRFTFHTCDHFVLTVVPGLPAQAGFSLAVF